MPDRIELALALASETLAPRSAIEPARPERVRSEAALIRGARAGSEADLEALFRRHWPRAYRTALLIVHDHAAAEDVAQEAFLSALRHLDRFDVRRHFGPWLSRIVANRAIDWTRMRAARRETSAPELPELPERTAAAPGPTYGELDELLGALAGLAPDHRAVIVLRFVGDFSPGEIARALGIPRGTVNSRLRRGLDLLRTRLDTEDAP